MGLNVKVPLFLDLLLAQGWAAEALPTKIEQVADRIADIRLKLQKDSNIIDSQLAVSLDAELPLYLINLSFANLITKLLKARVGLHVTRL